jgi:hypothetical protein
MNTLHAKWNEDGKPGWAYASEPARGIAKLLYFMGAQAAIEILGSLPASAVRAAGMILEQECQLTLLRTSRQVLMSCDPVDAFNAIMRDQSDSSAWATPARGCSGETDAPEA